MGTQFTQIAVQVVLQVVLFGLWLGVVLTGRAERANTKRTLAAYKEIVAAQERQIAALEKTVEILEARTR